MGGPERRLFEGAVEDAAAATGPTGEGTAVRGRRGHAPGAFLIVLACAGASACSQAPQPVQRTEVAGKQEEVAAEAATEPPATAAPAEPVTAGEPAAAGAASPAATPASEAPASRSGTGVVVLDPGEETSGSKTLVEAARAERERRARAGRPAVVITDKTLPHLPKGQLTYVQPRKADDRVKPADPGGTNAETDRVQDEASWRARAREIRGRWYDATEEIGRLEQSVADLRRRFYAEDDPYRRDVEIKPEWDHALDELSRQRDEARAAKRELDAFLEEGRRAGALPGWLREGSELEPATSPEPAGSAQAIEPPEADGSGAIEPPELGEDPPLD